MAKWRNFIEWQLAHYPLHKAFLAKMPPPPVKKTVLLKLWTPQKQQNAAHTIHTPLEWEAAYLEHIGARFPQIAWYVEAIEDVLQSLAPESRQLIELRYFQAWGKSPIAICHQLYIGRSHFYRLLNSALQQFAVRFGLAIDAEDNGVEEDI